MDWSTSDRPDDMLDAARELISDRQLLLFAAGCCQLAEGRVPHIGMLASVFGVKLTGKPFARDERRNVITDVASAFGLNMLPLAELTITQAQSGPWYAARQAAGMLRVIGRGLDGPWMDAVDRDQADLLREIVGDPFQSFAFPQAWRTESVVRIAEMLEETRDWEMMPVLADALEDAGCDDDRVLDHCRGTVHAPGCWVLDAVLKRNESAAVCEAA